MMFCSQHRILWVDWFLILTYFPALFLKRINCFNFAKHASCWSPGCHSAAFLHSPHKIKHWFCFLPWGTCVNPFTSYQRQQPESDVISCLDFLGARGLLRKFPCCFSPCFVFARMPIPSAMLGSCRWSLSLGQCTFQFGSFQGSCCSSLLLLLGWPGLSAWDKRNQYLAESRESCWLFFIKRIKLFPLFKMSYKIKFTDSNV